MASTNNNEIYDRYRKNRPVDIVNTVYLLFINSIYTFYMHNKYFDITGTRGKVFTYGTLFYIILIAVAFMLEIVLLRFYQDPDPIIYKDSKVVAMPELWMTMFFIANLFAFFMSPDKQGSWSGTTGRYFGLSLILVLTLMFIFLCRETLVSELVYICLFLFSNFAYVLAGLQHFGFDPFALRERVKPKQKEMFISLFGNINTYGSYICMALPIFAAVFIFSKKIIWRVLAGISLVITGMAIIPAKSDNVYLGLGVAFILLFYIAILNKDFTEYIFAVLLLVSGLEIMAILNTVYKGSQKHINGIAEVVENPKVILIILIAVLVVLILSMIFRFSNYEKYKKVQGKTFLLVFSVLFFCSIVGVTIWGIKTKNSMFVFNDEWGTYRGYIWRRGVSLFKESPVINKIFGNGNETVGYLMKSKYYMEMIEITGKKYDNLHNELLQFLVTTGIVGLISFLGFVISSFIYIGKRMKADPVAIGCLAAGVGYFAQSMVNLNQPITSPYFYVILATGVGYIRYKQQGYGKFKGLKEELAEESK